MTAYLRSCPAQLNVGIRTSCPVAAVEQQAYAFVVTTIRGQQLSAPIVIAASGGFGQPYTPALPGLDTFTGPEDHSLTASCYVDDR